MRMPTWQAAPLRGLQHRPIVRVLVWGMGYVGTVSAVGLAEMGHEVVGVDPIESKVRAIARGDSPVREPGLGERIPALLKSGRLRATCDPPPSLQEVDVSLICVGTPSATDGSHSLEFVKRVATQIAGALCTTTAFHTVVVRSTMAPGTTRHVLLPLIERLAGKQCGRDFGIVANPEFMRETSAIADFFAPPYIVIGEVDRRSADMAVALYAGIDAPLHRVSPEEAEMLKMVSNAFHALKIGFANEVGRLCAAAGMDGVRVMDIICADRKLNISPAYLKPGFAFGGSCLPKDVRALASLARGRAVRVPVLDAILPSNEFQIEAVRSRVRSLKPRKVAVLGIGFKPGSDDLRESPIVALVERLIADHLDVAAYDPDVDPGQIVGGNLDFITARLPRFGEILTRTAEGALDGAELVIVAQRRPEFENLIGQARLGATVIRLDASGSSAPAA